MSANRRRAAIVGLGSSFGERVVTNFDLQEFVDTSDEWIVTRTGIKQRHIANPGTTTSMLATQAAQKALLDAGINGSDVELIIVATVTPDMEFPATACLVQRNIGAKGAGCFDLSVGCTGFLYGVAIASQFIETGRYRYVLVIGADTLSKVLDWEDRSTCVLFGDGAGAAVLAPADSDDRGILDCHLGNDASNAEFLTLPGGGSLHPASPETLANRLHYVHMNGSEVFKFAVKVMPQACLAVLRRCGYRRSDVDFLIPHQANIRIIESALKRLELPWDKVIVNIDRYGNMSAASIPVAMEESVKSQRVKPGDLVLAVSFGAGLSWASCLIRW